MKTPNLSPSEAFREAVRLIGSQAKTADVCGVTQAAIWTKLNPQKIKHPVGPIAGEWCRPIEEATGGKITKEMLRPDLFVDGYVAPATEPKAA